MTSSIKQNPNKLLVIDYRHRDSMERGRYYFVLFVFQEELFCFEGRVVELAAL